ncbi:MAG: hypothetical protein ABI668_11720 [Sphingorhabdus sp.]
MAKARKAEVRNMAAQKVAALREDVRLPDDWRTVFLNAVLEGNNITCAARMAGVTRSRVYVERWDPAFDKAWEQARAYGRARVKYVSRPIWPPRAVTLASPPPSGDLWTRVVAPRA